MASNSGRSAHDILKEYLIAIGFHVDQEKSKRVNESLDKLNKRIEQIGTVAVGAAVALSVSVMRIASSLEDLYFASQRTGASVANIKALEYSAQQIGITAEASRGMLEAFARSLRLNPGLTGYLRSMGIDTTKDKVEVLMDLVGKLRSMPFPLAARTASLFGIDDNTLLMMINHYAELKKAQEEQRKLAGTVKYDEMAERAHRFMMELRELGIKMEGLAFIAADRLLPVGKLLIQFLSTVVDFLIKADKETDGWSTRLLSLGTALGSVVGAISVFRGALSLLGGTAAAGGLAAGSGLLGIVTIGVIGLTLAVKGLGDAWEYANAKGEAQERKHLRRLELLEQQGRLHPQDRPMLEQLRKEYPQGASGIKTGPGPLTPNDRGFSNFEFSPGFLQRHPAFDISKPSGDPREIVRKYATAMGVDVSLAEAQAWWESRFNQKAVSSKGAIGVMQLMPGTAQALGVDPTNMDSNIRGGIAHMASLLQKYKGNIALALAAYNAGEGAVQRYGGVPPFAETQQYVAGIMGNMDRYRLGQDFTTRPSVVMTQKTDINVNGTDNPEQVGKAVGDEQNRVNGDMLRNMQGAMR